MLAERAPAVPLRGSAWLVDQAARVQGDLVAEGLKVADVVADGALGAAAGVVEVGPRSTKSTAGSDSRCQMMVRMERPTATMALHPAACDPSRSLPAPLRSAGTRSPTHSH
jgi:hypothetical protein